MKFDLGVIFDLWDLDQISNLKFWTYQNLRAHFTLTHLILRRFYLHSHTYILNEFDYSNSQFGFNLGF